MTPPSPPPADTADAPATVLFFGHDAAEPAVVRRARGLTGQGLAVTGLMFRRLKLAPAAAPPWPVIELGITRDRAYGRRLLGLVRALAVLIGQRRRLRQPGTVLYARNLDMALLALLAAGLAGARRPLVYEALDVHRLLTEPGPAGAVLRWVERRVLARTALLVVPSPAFLARYFTPRQGYDGASLLVENKVAAAPALEPAVIAARTGEWRPAPDGRWRIGWFGSLRCVTSLRLLCALAARLPDRVDIVLRGGWPHDLGETAARALIATVPNLRHDGPYRYPDELPALYGAVDFYWGLDFHEPGANSTWLLPNRLYEGGLFGAVALAQRGTETGRRVEQLGLGWTFDPPFDRGIADFLTGLTAGQYRARRAGLLARPDALFRDIEDTARLAAQLRRLALGPPAAPVPGRPPAPVANRSPRP